ncbi:MAG: hypothetical protein Q9213_002776 [Squamulea squamosa]
MGTDCTGSESVQEVQTGPPRNLGLTIAQYVEAAEADRMENEVHDFNGWAHKQLNIETVQAILLEKRQPQPLPSMNIDWKLLHERLSSEEQDLDYYCRQRRGDWPEPPKKPELPWFYEVGDAAAVLEMQYEHVKDVTKIYAQRKPMEQRSIDQLIEDCDWKTLAKHLCQVSENLGWYFRGDPQGEARMRSVIECIQKHFFQHVGTVRIRSDRASDDRDIDDRESDGCDCDD